MACFSLISDCRPSPVVAGTASHNPKPTSSAQEAAGGKRPQCAQQLDPARADLTPPHRSTTVNRKARSKGSAMAGEEFERKLAAILAADVLDTSADGRGRGRHARPAQGCALDIDRAQDRRAPRSDSQAHRRWCPGRVRKRCRRGAVCGRGPTKHRRAQRGHQTRAVRHRPHGGDHRELPAARLAADPDYRAQDLSRHLLLFSFRAIPYFRNSSSRRPVSARPIMRKSARAPITALRPTRGLPSLKP